MFVILGVIFLVLGFSLLISNLDYKTPEIKTDIYQEGHFSQLTDSGIENTIGGWLENSTYKFSKREVPNTYFQFDIEDTYQRKMSVRRFLESSQYIQFITYLQFDSQSAAIVKSKQDLILAKLALELSKLGVEYGLDTVTLKINLSTVLRLDDSLNEVKFLEGAGLITRALIISKATILEIFPELNVATPPPSAPTFIPTSAIDPDQIVTIRFGLVGATLKWSQFNDGRYVDLSNIFPCKVHAIDNKIYIDTEIFVIGGAEPIHVRDNVAVNLPEKWDTNQDDYAYEVINDKGNLIFQMSYETQFTLIIYGIFPSPNGVIQTDMAGFRTLTSPSIPLQLDFIFKYPSKQFPGIRRIPLVINTQNSQN